MDELTIRTKMLENQQQVILTEAQKTKRRQYQILSCTAIYLVAFALLIIFRFALFNTPIGSALPGITGYLIIFAVATAIAITVNMHYDKHAAV